MQREATRHKKWTRPGHQQPTKDTLPGLSACQAINSPRNSKIKDVLLSTSAPLQQQYAKISKYSLQLKAIEVTAVRAAQGSPSKRVNTNTTETVNTGPVSTDTAGNIIHSSQHAVARSEPASGRSGPHNAHISQQKQHAATVPKLAKPEQRRQDAPQQRTAPSSVLSDQPMSSATAAGPKDSQQPSSMPRVPAAVQSMQNIRQTVSMQQSRQQAGQQPTFQPSKQQGPSCLQQQPQRHVQQQAVPCQLPQGPQRLQQQPTNIQRRVMQQQAVQRPCAHGLAQQSVPASVHQACFKQPIQSKQAQQQRQKYVRRAAGGKLITCPSQNENVKLVYKKCGNKLERTRVQAAVAGASLTWVNTASAPHLAAAAQAAVDAAAVAAAAQREKQKERLKQQQLRRQQRLEQKRQQMLALRQAAASRSLSAVAAAGMTARMHATRGRTSIKAHSYKMVRIGGQLYYSTPQGLCSAAAARLLAMRRLSKKAEANSKRYASAAAAVPAVQQGLGVQKTISKLSSNAKQQALSLLAVAGLNKRVASSSAVARSLAVVRGRNAAKRAAVKRGMCLHYCKTGKCDLALRGKCEKVHDPDRVAVCQQWLADKCNNKDCRLQHKVVPELMPVCMYYLEGVCSNRDCPYLHVKVAADAPACRAFLQGYCPAGKSCLHKHLTPKMIKQLQRKQLQQQQQQRVTGSSMAAAGAAACGAAARATGKVQQQEQVQRQMMQQRQLPESVEVHLLTDGVRAVTEVVDRSGSVELARSLEDLLPQAE